MFVDVLPEGVERFVEDGFFAEAAHGDFKGHFPWAKTRDFVTLAHALGCGAHGGVVAVVIDSDRHLDLAVLEIFSIYFQCKRLIQLKWGRWESNPHAQKDTWS